MAFRFEFDAANKILLLRFEGKLTDESLTEALWAIRECSIRTDASAGIWDFTSVTEYGVSPEFLSYTASREPAMPGATQRPRYVVVLVAFGLGISRMYEIAAGPTNPLLRFVLSVSEALAALGVQSPHFEPLA